jgi:hypothetical protein
LPWCTDRSDCRARSSHHHRSDWSRHQHCEDSVAATDSEDREADDHDDDEDADHDQDHGQDDRGQDSSDGGDGDGGRAYAVSYRPVQRRVFIHSLVRRSAVAERPHNLRQARSAERTHNSHTDRYDSTGDGPQSAGRSYRGSHRAERLHRTPDELRGSRVGRHHATDQPRDQHSRW